MLGCVQFISQPTTFAGSVRFVIKGFGYLEVVSGVVGLYSTKLLYSWATLKGSKDGMCSATFRCIY